MPSAGLRDCSSTGEPCAPKGVCTVRGGAVGKGPVQAGTSLAAYSTQLVRRQLPALLVIGCRVRATDELTSQDNPQRRLETCQDR